ncbi:MAG: hypothetical protein ACTSWU_00030 [Candidatus Thorarchaeota archaeon]
MWYNKIVKDIGNLTGAIEHFEAELELAKKTDLSLKGRPMERISAELPGVVEMRYNQLQEIEAILEYLNIKLQRIRTEAFRNYLEHNDRALSSRDAGIYADGDSDVADMAMLINEFALLRNKWIGLHKGIEAKSFQINNIVKLRTAGLDDATIM